MQLSRKLIDALAPRPIIEQDLTHAFGRNFSDSMALPVHGDAGGNRPKRIRHSIGRYENAFEVDGSHQAFFGKEDLATRLESRASDAYPIAAPDPEKAMVDKAYAGIGAACQES
jgi:hypothetical protein